MSEIVPQMMALIRAHTDRLAYPGTDAESRQKRVDALLQMADLVKAWQLAEFTLFWEDVRKDLPAPDGEAG